MDQTSENNLVDSWISVKERLPVHNESIEYVFADGKIIKNDGREGSVWFWNGWQQNGGMDYWGSFRGTVTHWMPLPLPPEPPK